MNKKYLNIIGRILMIASIAFIAVKLYKYDVDFKELMTAKISIFMVIAILVHGLNIFIASFNYGGLLKSIVDKDVRQKNITYIYCKTNIYKYMPGNIMHFVGRNQIAIVEGISHGDVILATGVEMVSLILAGGIITAICSFQDLFEYVEKININITFLCIIILCGLVMGFLIAYIFRKKIIKYLLKYKKLISKEYIKAVLKITLLNGIRLIVNAIVFLMLLGAFNILINGDKLITVVGIFVMSWVAGFLTPGAPGGLGVREFVMSMFLGNIVAMETLLTVIMLYRIVCIFGDLMGYFYAFIASRTLFRIQKLK
ncbi:MAG TPA: hypothetical protein DIC60_00010 [Lachnospiraceae bacterium]|nr:hypothetical protein [Lachnospiraceae bacterium]